MYWEKILKKILTEKVFLAPKAKNCSIKQKIGLSGVKRAGTHWPGNHCEFLGPNLYDLMSPSYGNFMIFTMWKLYAKILKIKFSVEFVQKKMSRSSPVRFSTETKSSRSWSRQRPRRQGRQPARGGVLQGGGPCRRCSRFHGLTSDLHIPRMYEPRLVSLVLPSSCPSSTKEAPWCG